MKKSILALGAATVIGGLGFAGSAQAIAYFGAAASNPTTVAPATDLALNPAGIGHILFVPYYTAQQGMGTLLTITNTDELNGKAVKVRFRGAANSDDVYDFTVMLSPGDVWTASITNQAGTATLTVPTDETTCTLPARVNGAFNTLRLAPSLSAAAKALHVNEGYVEILNMADVPPSLWATATSDFTGAANPLFTTIRHKPHGSPVCDSTILQSTGSNLSRTLHTSAVTDAYAAGLSAPTGQIMASFAVINVADVANYGGAATAIQAVVPAAAGSGNMNANGRGNIVYSPQVNGAFQFLTGTSSSLYTGDPLLRGNYIGTLWYDLPDMSTPYVTVPSAAAPLLQIADAARGMGAANALGKTNIINDYVNAPPDWNTDWVVAQPTRRYYAAVDYSAATLGASIIWNIDMTGATSTLTTPVRGNVTANPYSILVADNTVKANNGTAMGTYACMSVFWGGYDREENGTSAGTSVSPGATALACGEVYTLSFATSLNPNGSPVLGAQVSNQVSSVPTPGTAGWARVELGTAGGTLLPSVGYAATSMKTHIGTVTGNWGYLIPHRWN